MRISQDKIDRIKEEVLSVLFRNSPKALFTSEIAMHMARDEEFLKRLLIEMEKGNLIAGVKKNASGVIYLRRIRWRLTNNTFQAYQRVHDQNLKYDEKDHTYI
ncbi:hypothetical protein ACFLZZ_01790 [Nanoarchaeota archaeon]